jgi:glycosyltransferase involved in cell wall biosynthesis
VIKSVLIDANVWSTSAAERGMGIYLEQIIQSVQNHKNLKIYLLIYPKCLIDLERYSFCNIIQISEIENDHTLYLQNIINENGIETFINPCPFLAPLTYDLLNINTICVLYDLIPLLYPNFYLTTSEVSATFVNGLHRVIRADRVVCISKSVAKDLQLFFPECTKIDVIYPKADLMPTSLSRKKKMILSSVGMHASKNYSQLAQCLNSVINIHPNWEIVVVASSKNWQDQFKSIVSSKVSVISEISKDDFSKLFSDAQIYIHASSEEGFGIPLLNAINAGCAIVAGDTNLNNEIIYNPNHAYLFNLKEPLSMTQKCLEAVVDSIKERLTLTTSKLLDSTNWEHVMTEEILENSIDTINFVSPLPPQNCGIVDYSEAVLLELSKNYKVNVFTDQQISYNLMLKKNIAIYPWAFRSKKNIKFLKGKSIYQLGAAPWFTNTVKDLLSTYIPKEEKIVVIHDRDIGFGLYSMWKNEYDIDNFIETFLMIENNPNRLIDFKLAVQSKDDSKIQTILQSSPILAWLQNVTSNILTHGFIRPEIVPSKLIPMPSGQPRSLRQAFIKANGLEKEEVLLGNFGRITRNKYIEESILATELLLHKEIPAILLIVGEAVDNSYYEELKHLISRKNLTKYVFFTGLVTPINYWKYLQSVDFLISLRDESRGGLSAVLTNGLYLGKKIIASNIPEHRIISNSVEIVENSNTHLEIVKKIIDSKVSRNKFSNENHFSNVKAISGYTEALK